MYQNISLAMEYAEANCKQHYMIKTRLLLTNELSSLLNEKSSMSASLLVLLSSSTLKNRGSMISSVSQSVYRLLSMLFANYVKNAFFHCVRGDLAHSFVQIPYSGPE
jgi:hypothetical protein